MVWDSLGEYRYDGWRLHLLVGDRDVLVTAADLTWMKPRTAQRFLVKARAATFVVDGMWRGTLLTRLVEEMGGSPRVELIRNRARKEVFANTEKLRLLMDRHAQLDAYLERTQGEYLALALERGSEPAVLWAKEMGDPDLRKAFAYGRKQKPEVVEGWGVFTAKEHAPVTKSELLAALSQRFGNDRLVIVKDL